jgi:hypothetical protein
MLARQIAVGFGIAVVFPLLVYYSVAMFVSPPTYNFNYAAPAIDPNAPPEQRQRAQQERQQGLQQAQKNFAEQTRRFTLILFFIAVPLGLVAIVGGGWARPTGIGIGFLLGGILTVGQGCYFHWAYLNNSLRFASLLAGLLALIYAGLRSITQPSGVSGTP